MSGDLMYSKICTTASNLNSIYFAVPSCYATTNCNGGLINSSITFADCCANFGASYDLDGQCQRCPTTSM